MKLQRVLLLLILLGLVVGFAPARYARAQQGQSERYFDETGHRVSGDFYTFYANFDQPEFIFGYPITEAFTDARSGRVVQYFQRARFELYPDRPAGERVQPTLLGSLLYDEGPSLNLPSLLACRTYQQTGFSVCYAFLDFFDRYGGELVFGYPISGFEIYNGRIVQYFERARFEWYPDMQEGQKVVLANLGRIYFEQVGEDPALLNPVPNNAAPANVLELKMRVYTARPAVRVDEVQRIFVVVQDQALRPVPNADGLLTITWPESVQTMRFTTDKNGVAIIDAPVAGQPFGRRVTLTADVIFRGLNGRAEGSFRIWR